MTGSYRRRDV